MRNLVAMPAALFALTGAPAPLVPVTASEAQSTITAQIHRQVARRLRGGYSGETHCAGHSTIQQEFTPSTPLDRWRCKIEISGSLFPTACRAEADVFATTQAHQPRVQWLHESRYCHESRSTRRR